MQTVEKGQRIWNTSLFKMNKKLQQRTGTNKISYIYLGIYLYRHHPYLNTYEHTFPPRVRITIVSLCPSSRRFSRGVTHPRALSILQKKRKKERKKKKLVTCIDASIAFDEDAFLEVLCNERRAVRTLTIAYSFSTRIEFPHSSSYERFDHNVIVNANWWISFRTNVFSIRKAQKRKSATDGTSSPVRVSRKLEGWVIK